MSESINILIVEDEGIIAMELEEILSSEGYRVAGIADNAETALKIVQEDTVDLMLLDIHLKGDCDGIETARRITAIKDIPFIYLTAYSDRQTLEKAKYTHPSAFLVKPYQPKNLLIALEIAFNNFSAKQDSLVGNTSLISHPEDHASFLNQNETILCYNEALFIRHNRRFTKVPIEDILYLEVQGVYTEIAARNSRHLVRSSLTAILNKLSGSGLIQVHRSYAVNIRNVVTFSSDSIFMKKREVPLSRHYKENFFCRFDKL